MALSHQRIRFCNEYVVDLNATAAAVRAGYSESRAATTAYDLMQHPEVKAEIEDLLDARLARTRLTADRVLRELARLAFFDSRKLFREDGSPIPINELDSDTAAAIIGVDVLEAYEGSGKNRVFVGYVKKYKLADKGQAVTNAMKYLNLLSDRVVVAGDEKNPVRHEVTAVKMTLAEQVAAIQFKKMLE